MTVKIFSFYLIVLAFYVIVFNVMTFDVRFITFIS